MHDMLRMMVRAMVKVIIRMKNVNYWKAGAPVVHGSKPMRARSVIASARITVELQWDTTGEKRGPTVDSNL